MSISRSRYTRHFLIGIPIGLCLLVCTLIAGHRWVNLRIEYKQAQINHDIAPYLFPDFVHSFHWIDWEQGNIWIDYDSDSGVGMPQELLAVWRNTYTGNSNGIHISQKVYSYLTESASSEAFIRYSSRINNVHNRPWIEAHQRIPNALQIDHKNLMHCQSLFPWEINCQVIVLFNKHLLEFEIFERRLPRLLVDEQFPSRFATLLNRHLATTRES